MKNDNTRLIDLNLGQFAEFLNETIDAKIATIQAQPVKEEEELLTTDQAALFLKCSKVSLFKWIKADKISYIRIGGNRLRFKKSDLVKTVQTKKNRRTK